MKKIFIQRRIHKVDSEESDDGNPYSLFRLIREYMAYLRRNIRRGYAFLCFMRCRT